jgi:prophage regulatory protein
MQVVSPPPQRKIIRSRQVIARTGRSRSTIWRDVREGRFPAPVQLGPSAVGWYEDEIDGWVMARPRCAYAKTA